MFPAQKSNAEISSLSLLLGLLEYPDLAYPIKKYFFQAVMLMQGQTKPTQDAIATAYAEYIVQKMSNRIASYLFFHIQEKKPAHLDSDLIALLKASILHSVKYNAHYKEVVCNIEDRGGYDFARRLHNQCLAFVRQHSSLSKSKFEKGKFESNWNS